MAKASLPKSRHQILPAIDTDLKLLALIVLVVEVMLLTAMARADDNQIIYISLSAFLLAMVVLGIFFDRAHGRQVGNAHGSQARSAHEPHDQNAHGLNVRESGSELNDLINRLRNDLTKSGFKPDLIVGIARRGTILAGWLALAFGKPKIPIISMWPEPQPNNVYNKGISIADICASSMKKMINVVIVDDIAESGDTMHKCKLLLQQSASGIECNIKTAVIIYRPKHQLVERPMYFLAQENWDDDEVYVQERLIMSSAMPPTA
jgi:hypoxanthine phosphoribosyltransferase